ncbi:MAG: hypothetical protein EA424_02575 [Planctomycetaceae bacterium]|nr:MAG: hypothetical protein EA424_02575 [Planctomycetaceae bacterium]
MRRGSPRELSFTNALQTIAASLGSLPLLDDDTVDRLIESQLASLTEQLVGRRPNRVEPRAVKRRPKPQRLLTMPRDEARALLYIAELTPRKSKSGSDTKQGRELHNP